MWRMPCKVAQAKKARLVNSGRSLYEVQLLLGHADIKTTARYAPLNWDRLVTAVEAVPTIEILKKKVKLVPRKTE